jgi:hypothetical protein
MKESRLDELFRALPREHAGEGFTQQVMEAVKRGREPEDPPGRPMRRVLAVAIGLTVLSLTGVGLWAWGRHESAVVVSRVELRRQVDMMKREHRRLTAELDALRQRVHRPGRVVYLGGDDRVDYVLDLRKVAGGRSGFRRSLPASTGLPTLPALSTGGPL